LTDVIGTRADRRLAASPLMYVSRVLGSSAVALIGTFALMCGSATAAVGFRSETCGQSSNATTLTIAKPAGTAAGDVLIAHIGVANSPSISDPAGWTPIPALRGTVNGDQQLVSWYRIAGASEPSTYTFTTGAGTDGIAGGVVAYTGVDTSAPFAGTPTQTINESITVTDVLPNGVGAAAGSLRVSAVVTDDMGASTYDAPLVEMCDEVNGTGTDVATSFAREPTGIGTTATRSVTRDDNGRSILQTLVLAPVPCGAGGLNLTSPASISFGVHTLTGVDGAATTTAGFSVDDQTGTSAGWNLSATSTTFASGGATLPTTATTVTGVSATAGAARCSAPTSSVGYPLTLPAAAVAPAAIKVFNAAAGTGRGPTNLSFSLGLAIPAHARTGTYTSTWTFTLATGP
jgi:hypothetical protein